MSELFIPTARNSERFSRPTEFGKAAKYVPHAAVKAREVNRQTGIRKARALRESYRIERHMDVMFGGTQFDRGCAVLLQRFLVVREAENIDALFFHDRILMGLLEGANAFASVTPEAFRRLGALRNNAFDIRQREITR
jgi:hypothetical protein